MAMNYVPRDYQEIGIDFALQNNRYQIYAGMGMGKTSIMLTAFNAYEFLGGSPALVIAPKRVCIDTWPKEVAKWKHTEHFTIANMAKAKNAKKRAEEFFKPADIYIINFENLMWLWKILVKTKQLNSKFKTIIVDESTKLKGFRIRKGSRCAFALAHFVFYAKFYVNLTGTPCTKGLLDLWGQVFFVDRGKALEKSYSQFKTKYFYTEGYSKYAKPVLRSKSAFNEISSKIKPFTLSLRPEDYFDLEKPLEYNIIVNLPEEVKAHYSLMEKKLVAEFKQGTIEATTAATKTIKTLQMCSGGIYYKTNKNEKKQYEIIHEEKLNALEEIIEESGGENVIVAYHWNFDEKMIKNRFKHAVNVREENAVNRFNNNEIELLLLHPDSAGHGIDLQYGGRTIVFYSNFWKVENYLQAVERIGPVRQLQAGFKRIVKIYNIICDQTIDCAVVRNRKEMKEIQEAVIEYINERDCTYAL